jgi:hypothetical protein
LINRRSDVGGNDRLCIKYAATSLGSHKFTTLLAVLS